MINLTAVVVWCLVFCLIFLDCAVIIDEDERALVIGIGISSCALVPWTEIALSTASGHMRRRAEGQFPSVPMDRSQEASSSMQPLAVL